MNWKKFVTNVITNKFHNQCILVIGDLMVDEYVTGKVNRISPEAPVPVLDFYEKTLVAGGACNVANNLKSLGAKVLVAGVASNDSHGIWLREYLDKTGIERICVIEEHNRPTTVKTRFSVMGQQLLRVDNEINRCISSETQEKIVDYISSVIERIDAVVISDYTKGVFGDPEFIKKIISLCINHNIFVSVDSKSRDIYAFAGADFVKPNNLELEAAVGIKIEDDESFNKAGERYLSISCAKALIVTRGAKGISVFESDYKRRDFPAQKVQVYDVCGAGDTVISTVTIGMCSGLSISDSIKLANIAAGVVINKIGTVAISLNELIENIYDE